MPVPSQRIKKMRHAAETLSYQQALDFAQLILDIYKEKKQL